MPREQLKKDLEELQHELESMDEMDEELRERLQAISGQIDRLTEGEDGPLEELLEDVEERALVFENEHPRIAGILKRMVSALEAIGA